MTKCIDCRTQSNYDGKSKCICNNQQRCKICKDCRWCIDNDYNGYCIEKEKFNKEICNRSGKPGKPDEPDSLVNKKKNYIIAGVVLGIIYLIYIILIIMEYIKNK